MRERVQCSAVLTSPSVSPQEKQRQQDQQLQRHLTRPPPQYQDQPGQPANQNPFPQQPVNQFTGRRTGEVTEAAVQQIFFYS